MTIVTYSTLADNNQTLAPEGTMVVSDLNNAIRQDAANVRGFANELCWYQYGDGNGDLAPVRLSNTSFRVGADLRAVYAAGIRVRAVGSATGDITGYIMSSSFTSPNTTVNVAWDSGALQAEAFTLYVSTVRPEHLPALAGGRSFLLTTTGNERILATANNVDFYSGAVRVGTFTPSSLNLRSEDPGESVAPSIKMFRHSPSPAASDALASVDFWGRDSADAEQNYGRVFARIADPTAGTHSGLLDFVIAASGEFVRQFRMRAGAFLVQKTVADGLTSGGVELHTSGDIVGRDATLRGVVTETVNAEATSTPAAINLTGYTSGTVKLATFSVNGTERGAITWDGANTALTGQALPEALAVGAYTFAALTNPSLSFSPGDVVAGSALQPASILTNTDYSGTEEGSRNGIGLSGSTLPGTWRCMGYARRTNDLASITHSATLWMRIS